MQEEYKKEENILEKSQLEKEDELIRNIIETREQLKDYNKNFEYAEIGLVDYYIYQIKAHQSKLDYLIKLAKNLGITVDSITEFKYKYFKETG